jgi:acyl carrier protein
MSKDELFNKLKEILINEFHIDKDLITLSSRFYEDLNMDSLELLDLVERISEFILVDEEKIKSFLKFNRTIQNLIDAIIL